MRARLARLVGAEVETIRDLGTSHAWTLHRATLSGGRELFVKAASDQPGVFTAEAAGLRWLSTGEPTHPTRPEPDPEPPRDPGPDAARQAGAEAARRLGEEAALEGAAATVPVPEVVAADECMLVLPWLPVVAPTPAAAERFGRELAVMHTASRPDAYGAPWDGFIADLPLDNTLDDRDWPVWYAERRLEPFLRLGARHLSSAQVGLVERVIADIEALAGPPEPPSRIHGDLWSGNVLWTDGRGTDGRGADVRGADGRGTDGSGTGAGPGAGGRALLIDPAAHGGHRETDLAMMALFGMPQLDRVLAAYDEAAPLADGWRARIALHQLHPLLVHVALFGPSYGASLADAARAALG